MLEFVSSHIWQRHTTFSDLNIDLYGSSLSHIHHFNCHDQTKDENFLFHGQKQIAGDRPNIKRLFFCMLEMKKQNKIKFQDFLMLPFKSSVTYRKLFLLFCHDPQIAYESKSKSYDSK